MSSINPHSWNLTLDEMKTLQRQLAERVALTDQFNTLRFVAGTDVGFEDKGAITRGAIAILTFPELELVEYQIARVPTNIPYIPGFLSFRECPALLQAFSQLQHKPDLLLCDGQGIAHPRRFGIACHLGLLTDIPSIGVAKSRLIGKYNEVGNNKGDWQPLTHRQETLGAVVRTRTNTKPVFISPGHKVSWQTAINLTLECTPRYRLPETTRWADGIASNKPAFMKKLADYNQKIFNLA